MILIKQMTLPKLRELALPLTRDAKHCSVFGFISPVPVWWFLVGKWMTRGMACWEKYKTKKKKKLYWKETLLNTYDVLERLVSAERKEEGHFLLLG